jgi:hypothetical protein
MASEENESKWWMSIFLIGVASYFQADAPLIIATMSGPAAPFFGDVICKPITPKQLKADRLLTPLSSQLTSNMDACRG